MSKKRQLDEKKTIKPKPKDKEQSKALTTGNGVSNLQKIVGNRAIQRLLSQRSEGGQTQLDDETASRINRERGGGQQLDERLREQMESTFGYDFSDVRVHASPEADGLNEEMGAKAFTTGEDIFFRQDAYDPHSSGGQELIAHELTHVVQQGTGAVRNDSNGMTVNAPGDAFEQQADSIAHNVNTPQTAADVQRQDEEEEIQTQSLDEEEEAMQTQPLEEEEEEIQAQPLEEEEEEIQTQEEEEEEEEEEEALQMQEIPEEELI
jgi:hypothetical protein